MLVQNKPKTKWEPRTSNTVQPATPIPALDSQPQFTSAIFDSRDAQPVVAGLQVESTRGTQFAYQGIINFPLNPSAQQFISFGVIESLRRRKVYGYLWITTAAQTDYSVQLAIEFWRQDSKIGELPLSLALSAASTAIGQDVPNCFASGGNSIVDSVGLYLAQPTGGQPTNVILQPQYITVSADRVSVSVKNWIGVPTAPSAIRVWIGVISSEDSK